METFTSIIGRWPTAAEFGRDLQITDVRARAWKNRNSIPGHFWAVVEEAAQERGFSDVTVELMADIGRRKCQSENAA